jgi:hypothetical protein
MMTAGSDGSRYRLGRRGAEDALGSVRDSRGEVAEGSPPDHSASDAGSVAREGVEQHSRRPIDLLAVRHDSC